MCLRPTTLAYTHAHTHTHTHTGVSFDVLATNYALLKQHGVALKGISNAVRGAMH